MPAASNAIAPKGGYNHASLYWLSPATGSATAGDIGVLTAPTTGTEYVRFDGTTPSLMVDTIKNLTAAAMTIGNTTASQKTVIRAGTSADIEFNPGGTKTTTFKSGGNMIFAGTTYTIAADTSDASDNAVLSLGGGGAAAAGRGGFLNLYGNEHAAAGRAEMYAGNGAGDCTIGTQGTGPVQFSTAGTVKWSVSNAGTLVPNVDATYAIGGSSYYISGLYTGALFVKVGMLNTSVSSGVGSIKMCGTTSRNSTGFMVVQDSGGTNRYVPFFDTITG